MDGRTTILFAALIGACGGDKSPAAEIEVDGDDQAPAAPADEPTSPGGVACDGHEFTYDCEGVVIYRSPCLQDGTWGTREVAFDCSLRGGCHDEPFVECLDAPDVVGEEVGASTGERCEGDADVYCNDLGHLVECLQGHEVLLEECPKGCDRFDFGYACL